MENINETKTTDEIIVDGLTLSEHRGLGDSLAYAMQAVAAMSCAPEASADHRRAFEDMGERLDAVYDALCDLFREAAGEGADDIWPYPKWSIAQAVSDSESFRDECRDRGLEL